MSVILGIGWGHDSSICLIRDGQLLCAIEEEKLSRVKSEKGFPINAVTFVLKTYQIRPEDVSILAIPDRLYNSNSRMEIAYRMSKKRIWRILETLKRVLVFIFKLDNGISDKNKHYFESWLRKFHRFKNAEILYFDHHLCHAAGAYYASPFKSDLVFTCDGRGENDSLHAYQCLDGGELKLLYSADFKASIGQLYSIVTKYLGFLPNRHEGKVMGLAARGKDSILAEEMLDLFGNDVNGKLIRKPHSQEISNYKLSIKDELRLSTSLNDTGYLYAKNAIWLAEWLGDKAQNISREDIAYAVQATAEKVVLQEINKILDNNSSNNIKLSLSGGVFANVVLNKKIAELPRIGQFFIQPAMSDAGLSFGAACLALKSLSFTVKHTNDTYLGPNESIDFENLVPQLKEEFLVNEPKNIFIEIADLLVQNRIIGLYNGRNEFGPRALGNRSIIANPTSKEMHNKLNERLNRNDFMPFAPSILVDVARDYLEGYSPKDVASEYMTITYKVKAEAKKSMIAAVHVDGTARPHIVKYDNNPHYYNIIKAFYNSTGVGAVLNTSFNIHEEPIVATYDTALSALREGRIDFLNIDRWIISLRN